MDEKTYNDILKSFTGYLTEKKLRKTEERTTILEQICSFSGYFDICMLHDALAETKFHVSKATLYNTLDVFVDAGLVIKHQINNGSSVQYELRVLAESHMHAICMKCGTLRQVKNNQFRNTAGLKVARFSPEFFLHYIYGVCSKCKKGQKTEAKSKQNQKNKRIEKVK